MAAGAQLGLSQLVSSEEAMGTQPTHLVWLVIPEVGKVSLGHLHPPFNDQEHRSRDSGGQPMDRCFPTCARSSQLLNPEAGII